MQSDYEIIHPRFGSLLLGNCRLEKLYTGTRWAEGPCYFADGDFLIWSDIPNNRMLRSTEGLGVTVFRQPSRLFQRQHARSSGSPGDVRA